MEIEDIIQEIIEKEDEELKQQQNLKNKEEIKKSKEASTIKLLQRGLAFGLVLIILLMAFPWFNLGGSTTYQGFERIPKGMLSKEYQALDVNDRIDYEGVYIEASPIQLISYIIKYFDGHSKVIDDKGKEKISLFAWVHALLIYGFSVVAIFALISTVLLFILKELKWIRAVKYMGIFSLVVIIKNYFLLKITVLNMFALNALNELRKVNSFDSVYLTQKGLAVKNVFYPYFMTVKLPYYIAIALIIIWILGSIALEHIKKNKTKELI